MDKTSAARTKKFREKKKLEDPSFQSNENQRIRELRLRKKETMNEAEKNELRKYERERKRRQRLKKKPVVGSASYKSKQGMSQAVLRAMKSLPKSPSKQVAVVAELAKRLGIDINGKNKVSKPKPSTSSSDS